MKSLFVVRGMENSVHVARITKAAAPKNTPWNNERLLMFTIKVGAHPVQGTEYYQDAYGWRYRLKEV